MHSQQNRKHKAHVVFTQGLKPKSTSIKPKPQFKPFQHIPYNIELDDDETEEAASIAKAASSEAYMQTAIHSIQMHGGIGFTWDNDTHLWFKRAKSCEVFLGDPAHHHEKMMTIWDA